MMDGVQTYIAAQAKVRKIETEVAELAAAGKHKLKNKIINEQLRKACIARNRALQVVIDTMNEMAEPLAKG